MARIVGTGDERQSDAEPDSDIEWHTHLTFKLGPNPKLEEAHRKAIELDYGMQDGSVDIQCRLALAYYLERHLGLDLPSKEVSPKRQQIVLLNRKEIDQKRRAMKEHLSNKQ